MQIDDIKEFLKVDTPHCSKPKAINTLNLEIPNDIINFRSSHLQSMGYAEVTYHILIHAVTVSNHYYTRKMLSYPS